MAEHNETVSGETTENSGESKVTPGERLDSLIAKAKQLTTVANLKAKEITDAATPRIKQFGEAASQQISHVVDRQQAEGSLLRKARGFYSGVGTVRKRASVAAFALTVLIALVLTLVLIRAINNGSPTDVALDTAAPGTTVSRLSSLDEAAVKGAEVSLRKYVGVSGDWNPTTWVCSRSPNDGHNIWTHSGPGMLANMYHVSNPDTGFKQTKYYLANGISISVEPLPLSKADKLNGISWRGRIEYRCSLMRFYMDGNWYRWETGDNPECFALGGEQVMYGSRLSGDWSTNDDAPEWSPIAIAKLPSGWSGK